MADNDFHEFLNEPEFSSGDFNQITFGIGGRPDRPPGDITHDADKSVLLTTQLMVAIPLGTFSLLVFCYLRTRWNIMFAPRSRLQKLAPDPLPTTFFGWIIPLYNMPESHILDRVGLDAAVLLAFFKMSYKLFTFCAIAGFAVVGPILLAEYFHFLPGKNGNGGGGNSLGGGPVPLPIEDSPESPGVLASYAILTWVFSLATFYFTFYNYREFSEIRHKYYLKWKDTIAARTVMVTSIPKRLQTDAALAEFYESLELGAVESAVIYRNVRKLRHIIEKRTKYLQKLEEAYADYLNNPCKDPNYNPDEALKEFEKADDAKTANTNTAKVLERVSAERPKMFVSLFKRGDKIEYYTENFFKYDELVEEGRRGAYKSEPIGFVTFDNITSAQLAAQVLIRPEPFECNTELAPEPRDIYWYNMNIKRREFLIRNVTINIFVVLLVFFWSGPISVFATLLSLNVLKKVFPWLEHLAEMNEIIKGFIQGTLPTLAVSLFNVVLPKIMIGLSIIQGFNARSVIELSTFAKYYFFLLVNVLLVFSIAGAVATAYETITDPTGVPRRLAETLPRVSSFFVNFVVIQGIGLFPIHLLQVKEVAYIWVMRIFFSKTPRDYAKASAPPFMNYGEELPPMVLIFVIVIVYSSLRPVITLFGAIYFFLGYMCYKYLLLYVYFHPYETAGLAWPKIFRRIIIGLYIYQIMMIGYFSLRNNYYLAAVVFPTLICTFVFFYYVNGAYERAAAFIPLKNLREEFNKVQTNTADVTITPKSPENSNNPNENTNVNTDNPPPSINEEDTEEGHSQRDVLEDDLYHADPDLYTDYAQPPMTLYDGILNTGMRNYGPPALVGILPWLWLPVKRVPSDEASSLGVFHRILGMNKTGSKPIPARSVDIPRGETEEERNQQDLYHQRIADAKIKLATKRAARDPNNPNKIYYHHPERRRSTLVSPISPIASGDHNILGTRSVRTSSPERSGNVSREIPVTSREIPTTSREVPSTSTADSTTIDIPGSENLQERATPKRSIFDKFGKLAGRNF
ncbi:uncharacterized protein OCT59_010400 [Rhizophagus irregularis]|nr:hypothetical protein GLOIN_2v1616248 [Rhizophagus irregularis DAOM 181602=DAOM 197198]EXX78518.1 hypothetical protein RirG_014330 [Rhizophagus irregularis DAOM 197198w]PKK80819.1 DUF221-domain-containing protein [Rhizophagus irregularis]POG70421.1 hypothetical protein GLOIN_2v1616248 [Rhizophagus irregularis DAOM 181602=DAOM 197198]UZO19099.1 hypothetical protein OCT59_010400 [Rhizophagus irregularis]CAB4386826.1 unnamed protein product [Rhizophagus irregularis]|eukprot:XP_025177287.1 hypothetical protein GLOIN_2v1616248 [Rhizophagus irregularis DAOM 181602=DAOM 197198]